MSPHSPIFNSSSKFLLPPCPLVISSPPLSFPLFNSNTHLPSPPLSSTISPLERYWPPCCFVSTCSSQWWMETHYPVIGQHSQPHLFFHRFITASHLCEAVTAGQSSPRVWLSASEWFQTLKEISFCKMSTALNEVIVVCWYMGLIITYNKKPGHTVTSQCFTPLMMILYSLCDQHHYKNVLYDFP